MIGDTTRKFISHLKKHGPQTVKQLEVQPFWGGVRTRIGVLVKQGRIIRVTVANPYSGKYAKSVARAYKAADGAIEGVMPRSRRVSETSRDRKLRENRERTKKRAIAKAIILLEQQGYKVIPPQCVEQSDDKKTLSKEVK